MTFRCPPPCLAAALACTAIGLLTPGCGESETPVLVTTERGEPQHRYATRGEIVSLPDPARPTTQFEVRHEAIPDFRNAQDEVVGMNAMVMPFPLARGVSLEGYRVGDKVELEFAVWWEPSRHWEATEIRRLPPETVLTFGRATPPGEQPPAEPGAGGN